MGDLESTIRKIIDEEIERKLEEKLPEIIRALGIKESEPKADGYVDAEAVARMLGCDLSSPEKVRKAKKRVYNLAAQKLIPSVRLSERSIVFDPAKIREYLKTKSQEAA